MKPSKSGSKPLGKTAWEPPPSGWIKVNFDGSFVVQDGKAGAGVIARDSHGHVVFTAWRALFRCQNAEEAEALACLESLRLAAQWSQGSVIIETDCARIAKALEAKEDRSSLSFILSDAKLHARLLVEWRIAKVKRECNSVAHELASLIQQFGVAMVYRVASARHACTHAQHARVLPAAAR